ncbi:hypothetical protein CBS101457_004837 [Exobasidium rhododendri]|nr:hypothetical protein CBS101457_004837 [Exobasidium rhododendri]
MVGGEYLVSTKIDSPGSAEACFFRVRFKSVQPEQWWLHEQQPEFTWCGGQGEYASLEYCPYKHDTYVVEFHLAQGSSNTSIRAVTVRQILNAEQAHSEGDITVDGLEVGHVTFVGIIRNLSRNATNISYTVEDGTGTVDVRVWSDNSSSELMDDDELQTDKYVRIIGHIKTFQNRRTIASGHIRAITDFNEIFYHKLDVVHTHLQITKGPGGAGAGNGVKKDDMEGVQAHGDILAKIDKPIQRSIMSVVLDLRGDDENHGVAISVIVRRMPGKSESEVRGAVDDLIGDGYLYSAEDDEHVLATM